MTLAGGAVVDGRGTEGNIVAVTLDKFAEQLIRSGLLTLAEIAAFQESLAPGQQPKDAETLVLELDRARKLTKYQAAASGWYCC